MATVKWLPEALDDLKRLHAFIEPHSPAAVRRAVDALIQFVGDLLSSTAGRQPAQNVQLDVVKLAARGRSVL